MLNLLVHHVTRRLQKVKGFIFDPQHGIAIAQKLRHFTTVQPYFYKQRELVFRGLRRSGLETDHLFLSSTKLKNARSYTSSSYLLMT